MFVKNLLQTSEGTVKFEGELSEEEAQFVLAVGLNTLMENGAIPFAQDDQDDDFDFPEIESTTVQ